jgi:hypothetical protein
MTIADGVVSATQGSEWRPPRSELMAWFAKGLARTAQRRLRIWRASRGKQPVFGGLAKACSRHGLDGACPTCRARAPVFVDLCMQCCVDLV